MYNMEKISIVIPIYQVEDYLKRCIDSVLSQTYSNLQIILVDDGSKDKCSEICDLYSKKDSRIEVIHKSNGGLSDARNAGIKRATGKWIAFIDSDDFVNKYYIEHMYRAVIESNSDLVICGFKNFSEDLPHDKVKYVDPQIINRDDILNRIYSENHNEYVESVVTWNKLYKTEVFKNINFPKGKIHEDEATTYKIYCEVNRIALLNENLYYYFQNLNGIMKRKFNINRLDYLDALYERYLFFKSNNMAKLSEKTINRLYIFIVDYANLKEEDVENYKLFNQTLKNKIFEYSPTLLKSDLRLKNKIRIILSLFSLKSLKIHF